MLVQKRTPDSDPPPGGAPVPTIRVKVKFAGVTHEVYVNSQASFGDLKKLMSEKTGSVTPRSSSTWSASGTDPR
jgi:hypothetical protein